MCVCECMYVMYVCDVYVSDVCVCECMCLMYFATHKPAATKSVCVNAKSSDVYVPATRCESVCVCICVYLCV